MQVLVTGGGGFVGQALVRRLLATELPLSPRVSRPLTRLTVIDQRFDAGPPGSSDAGDPRVVCLEGDFADPALLAQALDPMPECVFHLASVPGSLAERDPALGWRVNLVATISLLQRLAAPAGPRTSPPPRVVFASSVAVYGTLPLQGSVDESWPTRPELSYGAHKRMVEVLLADLSRRRELDGVSLRLPGIVARPLSATGHGSAFMSDLIRSVAAGSPYACPVSAEARCWWMSLPCCLDNLVHAAAMPTLPNDAEPTLQLPVLFATVGEVASAAAAVHGRPAQVRYGGDERIETLFGRMPPLLTPRSRGLGFLDDGDLGRLVARAM